MKNSTAKQPAKSTTKTSRKPLIKPSTELVNSASEHAFRDRVLDYILFFFACAFIGWVWEVLLTFIQTGTFVNRGVLHGPWLPIYGFGGAGILILLNRFRNSPPVVFFLSALCCGIMEYLTGWYLETFKHLKWWDYSDLPLNLHGRICLLSVVCFGFCGLIIVYLIYPRLHHTFAKLKFQPKAILCVALVLFFLTDSAYSNSHPNTGQGITSEITSSIVTPNE